MNCFWVMCNNNLQAAPNMNDEGYPGWRNPDNFITVSDPYPTVSAHGGRPDPADRHVDGEGGRLRQCRTAHAVLAPAGQGAGRGALRHVWQIIEFSKYVKVKDVWPDELIARSRTYRRQDTLRSALRQRAGRQVPEAPTSHRRGGKQLRQRRVAAFRLLRPERAVRGVQAVQLGTRYPEEGPRDGGLRRLSQDARTALADHRRQGDLVALPRRLRPARQTGRRREVLRQAGRQGQHHHRALRAGRRAAGRGIRSVAVHRARARALALGIDDEACAGTSPGLSRTRFST